MTTDNYTTTIVAIAVALMWTFMAISAWVMGATHTPVMQKWYKDQNSKKEERESMQGPSIFIFKYVWVSMYALKAGSHTALTLYPLRTIAPDATSFVYLPDEVDKGAHIAIIVLLVVDLIMNMTWFPIFLGGSVTSRIIAFAYILLNTAVLIAVLILSIAGGLYKLPYISDGVDVVVIIALSIQIAWLGYASFLNFIYIT
jgi:fumarate reductase subunit D